jgi:hypothetical protein
MAYSFGTRTGTILSVTESAPTVVGEAMGGARSVGNVARPAVTESTAQAEFLFNRNLPTGDNPWIRYQQLVTGKSYEEVWQLNANKVALDGLDSGYVTEAKWVGKNDNAWASSPYNPDHEFYDESKILNQAQTQIDFSKTTNGEGVRFAISSPAGQQHFFSLFAENFPEEINSGFLNVFHVPGDGM